MRILHVLASAHLGGAEHVCLDLVEALMTRGQTAGLLVFEEGAVTQAARTRGLTLLAAVAGYREARSRRERWGLANSRLKSAAGEFRPEVVHSHVPLTNLICHQTLPSLGIPWIATMHGSWRQFAHAPEIVGRPWLTPYLSLRHAIGTPVSLRSARRVVAISEYVKAQLAAVGVSRHRVQVIYNGLSGPLDTFPAAEARAQLGLHPGLLTLGAMGYFAPVKGFDLLIEAVARMKDSISNFQTIIAGGDVLGDSRYRRRLEYMITRFGLQNSVRLAGLLPVSEFMSAIDVLVVSSRTEGFSLVLLEAMRRGLPSVVTSSGGCAEVARPEIESVMFRSGSPASLAVALRRLIEDASLQARLGRASQERAGEFTLERCAEKYEKLYADIL